MNLLTYLKDVETYLVSQMDEAESLDHTFDAHETKDCILCQTREYINLVEKEQGFLRQLLQSYLILASQYKEETGKGDYFTFGYGGNYLRNFINKLEQ